MFMSPKPNLIAEARSAGSQRFPLAVAGEGERVRIVAVEAGRGLTGRLSDMGLPLGSDITVVQRMSGGRSGGMSGAPLVVARGEARMALGAGMAHRILVTPVDSLSDT